MGKKITIIIPVIFINEFSEKILIQLSNSDLSYRNISFILICSNYELYTSLNIKYNFKNILVINGDNYSSNFLRKKALENVITSHVMYQDCDDNIDYKFLSEFISNINDVDNVYCFNILKILYDKNNTEYKRENIYNKSFYKSPIISDIKKLPTNIVNKIIPTNKLLNINFVNLPFTQDWCVSYQLFLNKQHIFINFPLYTYHNYYNSSAHINNTKFRTLLRVIVYKKQIINLYKLIDKRATSYLSYRYNILIFYRMKSIGLLYFPKFENILLFNTSLKEFGYIFIIYFLLFINSIKYYTKNIYKCIRYYKSTQ